MARRGRLLAADNARWSGCRGLISCRAAAQLSAPRPCLRANPGTHRHGAVVRRLDAGRSGRRAGGSSAGGSMARCGRRRSSRRAASSWPVRTRTSWPVRAPSAGRRRPPPRRRPAGGHEGRHPAHAQLPPAAGLAAVSRDLRGPRGAPAFPLSTVAVATIGSVVLMADGTVYPLTVPALFCALYLIALAATQCRALAGE